MMLRCKVCHLEKPLEEYRRWNRSKHGRQQPCKECAKAKQRHKREVYLLAHPREIPSLPPMTIGCTQCGEEKPRNAFYLHSTGKRWIKQPCKACRSTAKPRPPKPTTKICRQCKLEKPCEAFSFAGGGDKRYAPSRMNICQECHKLETRHRRARQQAADPEGYRRRHHMLGRRWRKAHPEQVEAISDRYRAHKKRNPYVEDVSLDTIYLRDKAICQICYRHCPRTQASRDHIIPVSLGGEHSYRNIVLAHRRCNSAKRNRAIPQQMRLFGT